MRYLAEWLLVPSLVLASSVAPAAGQLGTEANVRGALTTVYSKEGDGLAPRMFDIHGAALRRPGDFIPSETSALGLDAVAASRGALVSDQPMERVSTDAEPLGREPTTHHFGVQVGIFNPSTDVIELGNLGFRVERSDGLTILRYRYSLNPRIDLVAELRYWIGRGPTATTSGEGKVAGGFMGPGIRVHAPKGTNGRRVIPYLQGNVYYVQEMLGEPMVLYAHGIGYGLSGGVDIEVTRLITLPIEATYIGNAGGGLDDLSGFGMSVGVNFNF